MTSKDCQVIILMHESIQRTGVKVKITVFGVNFAELLSFAVRFKFIESFAHQFREMVEREGNHHRIGQIFQEEEGKATATWKEEWRGSDKN